MAMAGETNRVAGHAANTAIHRKPIVCPFDAPYALRMLAAVSQRRLAATLLCVLLMPLPVAAADTKVWKKVRYEGGTVEARVNRFDWNTTVTIGFDNLDLVFGGYTPFRIPVREVTHLSYGQKAYRRVADMATLSVFLTPVALFGVLHKSKDHLVSIEFTDSAGKRGAVLLMVHKDQYREFLLTLKDVTGKPVENWP